MCHHCTDLRWQSKGGVVLGDSAGGCIPGWPSRGLWLPREWHLRAEWNWHLHSIVALERDRHLHPIVTLEPNRHLHPRVVLERVWHPHVLVSKATTGGRGEVEAGGRT